MHRIDTPTAQKDKFGQGKNGFTNGDPATGRRATDLNSDMWDAVQEEVCTVIEAAGIQLSKGEHTQLYAAIGRLIDEQVKTRLEKNQNGADIPNKPLFLQNVGLGETVNQAAGAMQKSQNGADILDAALFRQNIGVYDATTSQKGIVMLSDNTGVPDSTTAATTTAVNYVLNQVTAAYSLAESKYTAGGATTGKPGLVQLVNSMGGSGSLVMPQSAVTTAIQSYPSLGKGQTLQDLRGSRSIDATYTNSTGFPIAVYVRVSGGYSANLYAHVNGIEFGGGGSTASNVSIATAFFIVPNGATYRVMASGASIALQAWSELR